MDGGSNYWGSLASRYRTLYDNDWSLFEDAVLKQDLQRLLIRAPGMRILDIGCGTGHGYELLEGVTTNIDYIGLDISGGMLREFERRHPTVRILQASGDSLLELFSSLRFDLVIATNVAASFLLDTSKMFRNVFSVLAPGGLIYLSFLNRGSLRRMVHGKFGTDEQYRTRGDENTRAFVWAQTYSRSQLVRMCQAAGFDAVRCCYRSVLGGVWESATSVSAERVLSTVVPWLGHSIAVQGTRSKEAGFNDELEALSRF